MLIDANNLALALNGQSILRDISLHMDRGDVYGLLGPNGAGKSTTIALLLGLYRPDRGKLKLFAEPGAAAADVRRRIGVMPESAGFYDWMNASDYLQWYSGFFAGRDLQIEALLERVGLAAAGHKPIGRFSRGMKQRLALARAMVHEPDLLILDEPTNGLDPRGRREIHDLLLELASRREVGVLLCTHLLDDVERLCSRVSIIDGGKTLLEGDLGELIRETGKPTYRLRVTRVPEPRKLPPVVHLRRRNGDWYTFEIDTPEKVEVGGIWEAMLARGWSFDEIHAEKNTLENRYLELTGESSPSNLGEAA